MSTIGDQTPFTPAIGALSRQIHAKQADRAAIEPERLKAERRAGACAGAYNLDSKQLTDAAAIAASKKRYEDAHAAYLAICEQRRQLDSDLDDLHIRLGELTTAHRLKTALGGATLTIPALPAPMANDPKLAELAQLARDVAGKAKAARETAATAAGELDAAETRIAAVRVDVHRGKAKRADVTAAEGVLLALRGAADRADQECADLDAAAGSIQSDIRAREDALVAGWAPMLRKEYAVRVQAFADAIRGAALAAEALRPSYAALSGVAAVTSEPWGDLLISEPQSKARRWLDAAIEAGEIK
jgi:hypothetical protein